MKICFLKKTSYFLEIVVTTIVTILFGVVLGAAGAEELIAVGVVTIVLLVIAIIFNILTFCVYISYRKLIQDQGRQTDLV